MIVPFLVLLFGPLVFISFYITLMGGRWDTLIRIVFPVLVVTVIVTVGLLFGVGLAAVGSGGDWLKKITLNHLITGNFFNNIDNMLLAFLMPYTLLIDVWVTFFKINLLHPHILLYLGQFPVWYALYIAWRTR